MFLVLQGADNRYRGMPAGRGKRMPKAIKDATGQLIIDQDEENMSDKEMYARNVPAIGKYTRLHTSGGKFNLLTI